MHTIEHYLDLVRPLLEHYGYLAVFGTIFVESFGVPAPGQSLLIGAALLADKGNLGIVPVLILAWSAAILGDNLGYAIGRFGGRRLLLRVGINTAHLHRVENFFSHYGGGMVVMARFFDGLRQLNGLVAGTVQMPWWRFLIFNALGTTLWVGVWGVGAYLLDRDFPAIHAGFLRFEPYVVGVGLVGLGLLVFYLLQRRGSRKHE